MAVSAKIFNQSLFCGNGIDICIDYAVEHHFARASYFIFYDTWTGKSEAIRDEFVLNDARIGQNTV
ncbi:MAG: hypothetical protein NTV68_09340 [Methanomicrobiales archaeon]|nr:hypothetical protein [Methanomicrobiales archaeon]